MTMFLLLATLLTLSSSVSMVTAQDGVTIEFLQNNATTARGTTLILRVLTPGGTTPGFWFRSPLQLPTTSRYTQRVNGTVQELEITNINDSDAGTYYFLLTGSPVQGVVTVVENAINGVWGEWDAWTNPPCPVSCGGGTRERSRQRVCDRPAPMYGGRSCVGSAEERQTQQCGTTPCGGTSVTEMELENNLVAYRGESFTLRVTLSSGTGQVFWLQNGQLITDGEKYRISSSGMTYRLTINDVQDSDAGPYIFFMGSETRQGSLSVVDRPVEGICSSAVMNNGVSYRYDPTDCDKYIQCYTSPSGQVGVYRICPFGYYWNQKSIKCDEYWKVDDCPVEKCNGSCGTRTKIQGSCGAYWECTDMGPRPMCCPPGYAFYKGKGCRPSPSSVDEMCPSPYACRDACDKRPVWSNSNKYEKYAGSQGWVEMDCPEGMYFDIGDCGCIDRDVPCNPASEFDFNSDNFGSSVESTSVTSSGDYISFVDGSRFSIDVRNLATGVPMVLRLRYRDSGSVVSELASMTNSLGNPSVVIYSGQNAIHFKVTAWTGCVEEMIISTLGTSRSDWKEVTLWYDGRHMAAIVTSGSIKNRARIYVPNVVFLENKLRLGTSDSNMGNVAMQSMNSVTMGPFNGDIDYVMIDICDGGLLI